MDSIILVSFEILVGDSHWINAHGQNVPLVGRPRRLFPS